LEHPAASPGSTDDGRKGVFEPPKEIRKLLRETAGTQMWQVEEARPRRGQRYPTIRYEVTGPGVAKTFGRPHEAWEYFQALTNAPDARPEPPPPAVGRSRT
jgi:hypothetical protein